MNLSLSLSLSFALTFKPLVLDQCLSARCCSVALPLPTTTSSPSLAFSRPDVSFITEELTALSREDVGLSPSNGAWQSTRWAQQLRDDGLRSSSSSFSFFSLSLFRRKGKDQYLSLCCAFASTVQFHRGELNQAPVDKFHVRPLDGNWPILLRIKYGAGVWLCFSCQF